MIKQDIRTLFQTPRHFRPDPRIYDFVGPVKIIQIQMPGIALSHSLRRQNKTLALRIHHIQCCLLIIKTIRKGSVHGFINILYIQRSDLLILPPDRTFYGVSPGSHVIHVGL